VVVGVVVVVGGSGGNNGEWVYAKIRIYFSAKYGMGVM
jgi:hypothetical protein